MRDLACKLANAMGGTCTFVIDKGYPATYNDPPLTQKMNEAAQVLLGAEQVLDSEWYMGAKDFSYYTQEEIYGQKIPGCFYCLDAHAQKNTQKINAGLLSPLGEAHV